MSIKESIQSLIDIILKIGVENEHKEFVARCDICLSELMVAENSDKTDAEEILQIALTNGNLSSFERSGIKYLAFKQKKLEKTKDKNLKKRKSFEKPIPEIAPEKNLSIDCKEFKLNVYSGIAEKCICGRYESEHKKDNKLFVNETTACDAFKIDIVAASFGTCVCGHQQAAHEQFKNLHSKSKNKTKHLSHNLTGMSPNVGIKESDDKCDEFILDMKTKEFGVCVCGMKLAAHKNKTNFFQSY